MPHKGTRDGSYSTSKGEHIAFGKKRSVTVSFTRAARKSKRYMVTVSRKHVHITRVSRGRHKKVRHRKRPHKRKHRRQRRQRRRSRRF